MAIHGTVKDGRGGLGILATLRFPSPLIDTFPIKASGSPTGFTVRHTAGPLGAGVRGAADRVLHRQRHRRTVVCHALPRPRHDLWTKLR